MVILLADRVRLREQLAHAARARRPAQLLEYAPRVAPTWVRAVAPGGFLSWPEWSQLCAAAQSGGPAWRGLHGILAHAGARVSAST